VDPSDPQQSIQILGRFNGPEDAAQGGHLCGLCARLMEGPAVVSLRRAAPLDTPLTVESGHEVRVLDGEALVAEVQPGEELELDVPHVTPAEARTAARGYRGSGFAVFDRCYVCGPRRDDALGVFPWRVPGREVVASPWTPPAWAADASGTVAEEHVWAAMDCPTYFAAHIGRRNAMSVLARMSAQVRAPVRAESEHVVVSWPLGAEGRKRHAASAVLTAEGDVLAVARVLLVDLAPPAQASSR
jgi:hypothetical protein